MPPENDDRQDKSRVSFRKAPPSLCVLTPSASTPSTPAEPLTEASKAEILLNNRMSLSAMNHLKARQSIVASMTNVLPVTDHIGPDVLIIVGVILTTFGTAITLVGAYVHFSNSEVHMMVVGIGPSLIGIGLLFCVLRLFFWKPACCAYFQRIIDARRGIRNSVHPSHQSSMVDLQQKGDRSTLSLDVAVLMTNNPTTSKMEPSPSGTGGGGTPQPQTGSQLVSPDSHLQESEENNDNEMTESLLNCMLAGEDVPMYIWNIPMEEIPTRKNARQQTAASSCSTPTLGQAEKSCVNFEKNFVRYSKRRSSLNLPLNNNVGLLQECG